MRVFAKLDCVVISFHRALEFGRHYAEQTDISCVRSAGVAADSRNSRTGKSAAMLAGSVLRVNEGART